MKNSLFSHMIVKEFWFVGIHSFIPQHFDRVEIWTLSVSLQHWVLELQRCCEMLSSISQAASSVFERFPCGLAYL